MDDLSEIRYDMSLGRYLLTAMGTDTNFSKHTIVGGVGTEQGCTEHVINLKD